MAEDPEESMTKQNCPVTQYLHIMNNCFIFNILETFSGGHFIVLPSPCKDGDIAFYNKSDLTFVTIEYRSSQDLNLVP